MGFDCFKLHPKCKGGCCGVVPIPKDIWNRNKHKAVNDYEIAAEDDRDVLPDTKDGKCPFLNKDYTCAIYDDRPELCKKYGDESHAFLTCPYQDKNGRERSRQEQRKLMRDADKRVQSFTKAYSRNDRSLLQQSDSQKILDVAGKLNLI